MWWRKPQEWGNYCQDLKILKTPRLAEYKKEKSEPDVSMRVGLALNDWRFLYYIYHNIYYIYYIIYNYTDYIGVFTSHQKYCLFFHLILKGLILLWKKLWNSTILTLSSLMSHRIQAWSKMSTFFKWTNQDQTCDQSCKMLCADLTEKLSYTDKLDIVGIAIHQNKLIWGKGYPSLPILQFFNIVWGRGG